MKDDQLTIIYVPKPWYDEPQACDDTDFIQDCIDGGIQPPPGTYRISRTINVGVPLKLVEID